MATNYTRGRRLRNAIMRLGTQREFADRLGVTVCALQWWISGRSKPSLVNREKIKKLTGVSF